MDSTGSSNSMPQLQPLTFVVNPMPSTDDQLNERSVQKSKSYSLILTAILILFFSILEVAEKVHSSNATYSSISTNPSVVNFPCATTTQSSPSNVTSPQQMSLLLPNSSNSDSTSLSQRVKVLQCVISRHYIAVLFDVCLYLFISIFLITKLCEFRIIGYAVLRIIFIQIDSTKVMLKWNNLLKSMFFQKHFSLY